MNKNLRKKLYHYRFEYLLIALLILLFDKIFFPDIRFFISTVWPINMIILAIASLTIFKEKKGTKTYFIKNFLAYVGIIIPFLFLYFKANKLFLGIMVFYFFLYYTLLFYETLVQVLKKNEVTLSIVLGCACGYLLLILIASSSFMIIELFALGSFVNVNSSDLAQAYTQLVYFSFTLITSTGFGDITPITDTARLTTSFFSIVGQFYMVVIMGVIISKFSTRK